jgi:hypothetical protein
MNALIEIFILFAIFLGIPLAILNYVVLPLFLIKLCQRYREEYLHRLRIRRAQEAAQRGGGR